jgi:hypothetical protein
MAGQEFGAGIVHINDGLRLTTRENRKILDLRDTPHCVVLLECFSSYHTMRFLQRLQLPG